MRTMLGMVCLLLMVLPLAAQAQSGGSGSGSEVSSYLRSGSGNGLGLNLQPLGLLDPSRMTFNHSYSMSYLTSGGQGVMRGLFMETIGYRISNPLSLTLNLGYMHQPYSSFGPDGLTQEGTFVGGAALNWQPAKNMFLHFEVGRYPVGSWAGYNPYLMPMQSMPIKPTSENQNNSNSSNN